MRELISKTWTWPSWKLKALEKEFAKALGFEDHQRVIGTHQNTNNFHMHVAYNKIHPDTLRNHSPKWDFYKLAEVCKEMELKYELSTDHDKAKDKEAHTWEESFDTYVKGHKADIQKDLKDSENWQEFHKSMDQYDIRFKPRGAGLVIQNLKDKQQIKASAKSPKKDSYKPRPTTKHPKPKNIGTAI